LGFLPEAAGADEAGHLAAEHDAAVPGAVHVPEGVDDGREALAGAGAAAVEGDVRGGRQEHLLRAGLGPDLDDGPLERGAHVDAVASLDLPALGWPKPLNWAWGGVSRRHQKGPIMVKQQAQRLIVLVSAARPHALSGAAPDQVVEWRGRRWRVSSVWESLSGGAVLFRLVFLEAMPG